MGLCTNRPEGFGPTSHLSSPLPTTCFIDTILIPLPIWLSLALLPLFYILSRRSLPSSPTHPSSKAQKSKVRLSFTILYYLLIIAQILMITLEIARLALAHIGIGLIPFSYIGLVLAAFLHFSFSPTTATSRYRPRLRMKMKNWEIINMVLWLGGMTMSVISAAGLAMQPRDVRDGRRKDVPVAGKYPVVDEVTDLAVLAGVYGVLAGLEVGLGWGRWRRGGMDGKGTGEELRGKGVDV